MKNWGPFLACITCALASQAGVAQEIGKATSFVTNGSYSQTEAFDEKKVCSKGKPCGDTCINVNYTCRINTPSPYVPTTPTDSTSVPEKPPQSGVMAGGRYDGIYQSPISDNSWVSVHHNDVRIVAAQFESQLQFNSAITSSLGRVTPPVLSTWSLLGGTFSGNQGNVSGEMEYGACNISLMAVFSDTGFSLTATSATQTTLGKASGYDCGAYMTDIPWPLLYKRIF